MAGFLKNETPRTIKVSVSFSPGDIRQNGAGVDFLCGLRLILRAVFLENICSRSRIRKSRLLS